MHKEKESIKKSADASVHQSYCNLKDNRDSISLMHCKPCLFNLLKKTR